MVSSEKEGEIKQSFYTIIKPRNVQREGIWEIHERDQQRNQEELEKGAQTRKSQKDSRRSEKRGRKRKYKETKKPESKCKPLSSQS